MKLRINSLLTIFSHVAGVIALLNSHRSPPPPSRWKHGRQISGEGQGVVGRLAHETAQRTGQPAQPSLRCCRDGTACRHLTVPHADVHSQHRPSGVFRQAACRPAEMRNIYGSRSWRYERGSGPRDEKKNITGRRLLL